MKILLCCLMLAGLVRIASADVDVSGKWSGSFNVTRPDGETKDDTALLVLKQNGSDITGTAGPNEGEQYPITKGRIDGNRITLEIRDDEKVIQMELLLADDRLKGEANMSHGGETAKAKVDVGRAR